MDRYQLGVIDNDERESVAARSIAHIGTDLGILWQEPDSCSICHSRLAYYQWISCMLD